MYTILINSDNTLTQSIRERIMHRESNVHTFRFLVDPVWVDRGVETDMRNYTCLLEYKTPISSQYVPVPISPSETLYKDKLEYLYKIGTDMTCEIGNLELKFIFMWLEMTETGQLIEHSRKTDTTIIPITPTDNWSDYIADSKMDNIVQIMLSNQANAEQIKEYATYIAMTKADSIKYNRDTNELSLHGNGQKLDSIILEEDCECEDGVPVVDFTNLEPSDANDELNNVVEF